MHASAANPPHSHRLEWLVAFLLGTNLVWTTLALGGYRPETRVVSWCLTGVLLLTLLLSSAVTARPLPAFVPANWILGPFVVYAAANVVFLSPVPWLGWIDWMSWANLAVIFWVVRSGLRSRAPRRAVFLVLVGLGLTGVALGCYQVFVRPDWLMLGRHQAGQFIGRASGSFGIPNSLAGFLILLLPATGALAWRATALGRIWWGWVTAVLVVGLFLTLSRGAWLGLAVALVVWPLLRSRRSWRFRFTLAGSVLSGIVLLGSVLHAFSPSARVRLDRLLVDAGELSRPILWRGAWELWRAKPVTGTGAGSYNVLFEGHRPPGFVDEPQWAHNEYLNALSDYGLLGVGLLAFAVVRALRGRRHQTRARRAAVHPPLDSPAPATALGIGMLAFALQMTFEFHLKIPALGLALAVVAALAIGPPEERRVEATAAGRSKRRAGGILLAVSASVALGFVLRWQQSEACYRRARESLDAISRSPGGPTVGAMPILLAAEADARRATELWPRHGGAWSELAAALQFQSYVEPARSRELAGPAEAAARKALLSSDVVPEFWLRLGIALDQQGRRSDAREAYQRVLALAPRAAAGWYYYADHLARDTETRAAALRAIATCLSLDPGNVAAEALQAKLLPSR